MSTEATHEKSASSVTNIKIDWKGSDISSVAMQENSESYDEEEKENQLEDMEEEEVEIQPDDLGEEEEDRMDETELDVPPQEEQPRPINVVDSIQLSCRSVRIGSFKVFPLITEKYMNVYLTTEGISFESRLDSCQRSGSPSDESRITIIIKPADITNMLVHFGHSMPLIFLSTTIKCADDLRKLLNLCNGKHVYHPNSTYEMQKFLSFLVVTFTEEQKGFFRNCFVNQELIKEINQKTANNILVNSTPQPCFIYVYHLFIYPSPPQTGGMAITNQDAFCLNEGLFLNDTIIDFYLKYIFYEKLSEDNQHKSYIFNSFFYTSLAQQAGTSQPGDEIQKQCHNKVKRWTKNVDIFSKDFLLIPINQSKHWFLAIICFPGLVPDAPEINTNTTVDGNSQISYVKFPNMNSIITNEEQDIEKHSFEAADTRIHPDKDWRKKKVPCICFFDSLNEWDHTRIATLLREYLTMEYQTRKGTLKAFDEISMKGHIMKCPQQTNNVDCGVYMLQYVECFFEYPLPYFDNPMPDVSNWFSKEKIDSKRLQIFGVITDLEKKFSASIDNKNQGTKNLFSCKNPHCPHVGPEWWYPKKSAVAKGNEESLAEDRDSDIKIIDD